MCRFALYLGDAIPISSLVTEPSNSIIHQSFDSHERSEPLNGDGFGIGWYPGGGDRPALFRSTTPAWSNRNLREMARVTRTRCLLAHVRAASPGIPVAEMNCHPFLHNDLTFMHNGDLGGFHDFRRQLLDQLSEEAFSSIEGTTDSEHIFAVFQDALRDQPRNASSAARMAQAMSSTIERVEDLRRRFAPSREATLNLVACDGTVAVATRYASDPELANSLHFASGAMYTCDQGMCHMDQEAETKAVLIVSEPLDDSKDWSQVTPGNMLVLERGTSVRTEAL